MESARFYKYRTRSYDPGSLTYKFLQVDSKLRDLVDPPCGIIIFVTSIIIAIVIACSIACSHAVISNIKVFEELQKDTVKKIPRKKSIIGIRPVYNCIHKHLQQTKVFQEKTRKMLCKEHLELEILNSRISCINKLLKPEAQSEWRRSRSPKVYHRSIEETAS